MAKKTGATPAARKTTKHNRKVNLPRGITFEYGSYRVRWTNPAGSRQSKSFPTLGEAKLFKAERRAEALLARASSEPVNQTVVPLPKATVEEAATESVVEPVVDKKVLSDIWDEWRAVHGLKKRSAAGDESIWRVHLGPALVVWPWKIFVSLPLISFVLLSVPKLVTTQSIIIWRCYQVF